KGYSKSAIGDRRVLIVERETSTVLVSTMRYDISMDERDFYTERPETKTAEYTCPRCKRSNQYQVRWMRRTKKDRLPPRADERDRALYAKLRDYLIRVDDDVTCKTCQKRF